MKKSFLILFKNEETGEYSLLKTLFETKESALCARLDLKKSGFEDSRIFEVEKEGAITSVGYAIIYDTYPNDKKNIYYGVFSKLENAEKTMSQLSASGHKNIMIKEIEPFNGK